jgi:hypothetical protein
MEMLERNKGSIVLHVEFGTVEVSTVNMLKE